MQLAMPELPATKRRKFLELGLPLADVLVLADDAATATYYENVLAAGALAKPAANWVIGDIMAHCKVPRPLERGHIAESLADERDDQESASKEGLLCNERTILSMRSWAGPCHAFCGHDRVPLIACNVSRWLIYKSWAEVESRY